MTISSEQRLVDHLYAEIDHANKLAEERGFAWRFVRSLDIRQMDPEQEVSPPDPPPPPVARPTVTGDTVICPDCAALLPAAGCQPCHECGSTSKGCA